MKIALALVEMSDWFDGDFSPVIDLVRTADAMGIDQVVANDHVAVGENTAKYPYGTYPHRLDYPCFEPMSVLSALASVTKRIRLSTGVLIGPLRSAVLLAKQVATLDVLSGGRVDIGLGVGWQTEEHAASGVPWDKRFLILDEQVRACRVLWSQAPATFRGSHVTFDRLYSFPQPLQGGRLPVIFGLGPTQRNFARIAELGDGWAPMERDPQKLRDMTTVLRSVVRARGRDPDEIQVRASPQIIRRSDGSVDFEAFFAQIRLLKQAGATMVTVFPARMIEGPDGFQHLIERMLEAI